ncbi:ankyrin repeat and LEM domain-containing protein 1 [Electrophorus electricus]|uniref:ankyrin repeat and LEM domain-containing protein 1 n=1 Tax=Electrophorus electricus TaxID=8005 RepID=UPI0015CF8D25|nr:ankyrin repeat and LEM domain-containing protein 1 [Electrophorus electricus]
MSTQRNDSVLASLLCTAVNNTDVRSVEVLLLQGASPNTVLEEGLAAVHIAAGKESEKGLRCLRLILQHGAEPNLRSVEGLTPLHIAASWGCYQNLKLLLKNGGNPSIKDQEGNKPADLAEQEENSRCASILREHESQALPLDCQDIPKFQYSLYSDCSPRDSTIDSVSMLSDFGDEVFSSTRHSSLFHMPGIPSEYHWARCAHESWLSEVSGVSERNGDMVGRGGMGDAVLSSTRLSVLDVKKSPEVASVCKDREFIPRSKHSAPFFPLSRKSVSFRDSNEYFPASLWNIPAERQDPCDMTVDFSQYPDFLDSERMATVLQNQGIDVTSPDDVFVFCRETKMPEDEFEKTVIGLGAASMVEDDVFADEDDEQKGDSHAPVSSSSGSSQYSSCDSNPYKSAVEAPLTTGNFSPLEKDKGMIWRNGCDGDQSKPITNVGATTESTDSNNTKMESFESATDGGTRLMNESKYHGEPCVGPMPNCTLEAAEVLRETHFTTSPFVTGRTRSRLSRCSQRISNCSQSLLHTSSLFEQTLPTPIRMRRNTVKSPRVTCDADESSRPPGEDSSVEDLRSHLLRLGVSSNQSSDDYGSQADTLIISRSMADTVIMSRSAADKSLEGVSNSLTETSENSTKETTSVFDDEKQIFTSDRTTSSESSAVLKNSATQISQRRTCALKENEDGLNSQEESCPSQASLESTSSCSSECSLPPGNLLNTPSSGCTPRYSMSRFYSHSPPQTLANLSYTPGGRPHITDVDEPVEYLYTDTEEGHKLIETHVPPTSNASLSSSLLTSTSDDTVLYDWRSLQSVATSPEKGKENHSPGGEDAVDTRGLTDQELRHRLQDLGEEPGPISTHTRPLYIQKLRSLQKMAMLQQPIRTSLSAFPDYSAELNKALRTFHLPDCKADEFTLCEQFDQPDQNKHWREGIIKSSFNYLLLDPRVTRNLPYRSQCMSALECFQTFVSAIFYIGKGKRSRPYSHLYEALEYFRGDKTSKKLCSKVQHILQVWNCSLGVVSLHCFQNVIPVEAYTREACMVDAIGLKMLTNQKRGDYYGVVSTWPVKRKRELGVHLLYRAMQIFLAEGERQLRPTDIRLAR